MKISATTRRLAPSVRLALIYGPDDGQIREVATEIARSVVGDLSDPFRIAELSHALLKSDPARLSDEVAALSLTGGRRVVWVRDADDTLAALFAKLLATSTGDALVIALGGELGSKSALRKLAEESSIAAAIPCYLDETSRLDGVISETLGRYGLTAAPDAMAFLTTHLGGDRLLTRREIEKLALYAMAPGKMIVTYEDALACVGDSAAMSLEDMCFAAADGDFGSVDRLLDRLFREGLSPIAVLRAALRHIQRLHLAAGYLAAGKSAEQAVAALRPPVFFKHGPRFRAQLRAWSLPRLAAALERIVDAERACKTTGMPADALCARALMGIASAGARGRRR